MTLLRIINRDRFFLPDWNAATAMKTNSGTRNLILIRWVWVLLWWLWIRPTKMSLLSVLQPFISSITSHVSHWQAAPVPLSRRAWPPPYLGGQLGGVTSPHSRILIQSVNAAHCRPFSHTGHYLGCHCVCLSFSSEDGSPCNESNVYFFLGMEMISPHVLSLWLRGDNAMQYDNILQ